jgi:hypothetical protein
MSIVSNDIDVVDEYFTQHKNKSFGHDFKDEDIITENHVLTSYIHDDRNCKLCQVIKSWETLSERLRYLYT